MRLVGLVRTRHFNPRAHTGRDDEPRHGGLGEEISIHAPAWGATEETIDVEYMRYYFNPRAPRGARQTIL